MEHLYHKGDSAHPFFILLHGTGGTEDDLIAIKNLLNPKSGYLSFRGDVNEYGANRFFKRLSPGVFDETDLINRTYAMINRIKTLSQTNQIDLNRIIALGYSNGANLIASILFHDNKTISKAVLYNPVVPIKNIGLPSHVNTNVFISAGINDPISPKQEVKQLISLLKHADARLFVHWTNAGHQITKDTITETKRWIDTIIRKETH